MHLTLPQEEGGRCPSTHTTKGECMYKFKIESLNCMSCFHNIEDSLKEFDKDINAKADIRNQTLTVETSQPVEKVKKLIEDAGYPVNAVIQG
jgi:copper chaperone CopZ